MAKVMNAVGLFGAVATVVGLTLSQYGDDANAQPKTSPLVCEFDKAHNALVIRDTRNNHIAGAMYEAFKVEDRAVTGVGGIYPEPGKVGIETGIQFKADFAARTCEAKHSKDSLGLNALSAPMVPALQSYSFIVK